MNCKLCLRELNPNGFVNCFLSKTWIANSVCIAEIFSMRLLHPVGVRNDRNDGARSFWIILFVAIKLSHCAPILSRHCERSEAISFQFLPQWRHSLSIHCFLCLSLLYNRKRKKSSIQAQRRQKIIQQKNRGFRRPPDFSFFVKDLVICNDRACATIRIILMHGNAIASFL